MPRVQVQSPVGPQGIRPAASPVSRTARAQVNGLQQLAGALAEVEPALGRLTQVVRQQEAEKALAEGSSEAQRLIDEQVTYAQAVKDGLIRPDQNPWFRLGMKQQFGEVAANDYGTALRNFTKEMIDRGVNDPSQWDQLEAQFRTQWVNENVGERDAAFDLSFADKANNIAYGIGQNFAAAAGQNAMNQVKENAYAQTMGMVRQISEGATLADIQTAIRDNTDILVNEMGVSGSIVNPEVVKAITDAAIIMRDPAVLDLLDPESGLRAGTGPLGNTEYAVAAVAQARKAIVDAQVADWAMEDRERQRRAQQIYLDFNQLVSESEVPPSQEVANDWARRVQPYDAQLAEAIREMPGRVAGQSIGSNPTLVNAMGKQVLAGEIGQTEIVQAMNSNRLNYNEGQRLLNDWRVLQNANAAGQRQGWEPLRDPYWTQNMAYLRDASAIDFIVDINGMKQRQVTISLEDARETARRQMIQWLAANPEASQEEVRVQMDAITHRVRERYFPAGANQAKALEAEAGRQVDPRSPVLTPQDKQQLMSGNLSDTLFIRLERVFGIDPTDPAALDAFMRDSGLIN